MCGWAEKETEFTLEEIQPKNIAVIKDCVNLYKWQSYEKSHSPKLNPSSKFLLLWDVKCSFSKALPPLFLIEFYNPKWIFGLLFGKMISYIFLLFSIIWSFYVPGNDYNLLWFFVFHDQKVDRKQMFWLCVTIYKWPLLNRLDLKTANNFD